MHKAASSRLCILTIGCKIKEIKKNIKSYDRVGKKTYYGTCIDQITGDILQNLMKNYDRVDKHEKVAQAAANVLLSLSRKASIGGSPCSPLLDLTKVQVKVKKLPRTMQ